MIAGIAEKIACRIKNANPDETHSVDIMKFALSYIIHFVFTFVLCLIVGNLTGKPYETMVSLWSFFILRSFSGGFHLKSLEWCMVVSALIFAVIPFVPLQNYTLWLTVIALILIALLSPRNMADHLTVQVKLCLKVVSILIVCSNFYLDSFVAAMSFLVQGLLLIPGGGEINDKVSG